MVTFDYFCLILNYFSPIWTYTVFDIYRYWHCLWLVGHICEYILILNVGFFKMRFERMLVLETDFFIFNALWTCAADSLRLSDQLFWLATATEKVVFDVLCSSFHVWVCHLFLVIKNFCFWSIAWSCSCRTYHRTNRSLR